jgi:hypothetical protein
MQSQSNRRPRGVCVLATAFGLLAAAQIPAFATVAVDPLKFTQVIEGEDSILETDLSTPVIDADQPALGVYKNSAGTWKLMIYGPVLWSDEEGNMHEVVALSNAWRKWMDGFGRKVVKGWTVLKQRPNENVTVGVTLMNEVGEAAEPANTNGLKFTPEVTEEKRVTHPFSKMVQDITGISEGKAVGEILPGDAKTANALHLKMRFIRNERKIAAKKQ